MRGRYLSEPVSTLTRRLPTLLTLFRFRLPRLGRIHASVRYRYLANNAVTATWHEAGTALLTLPSNIFRHISPFSVMFLNVSELQTLRYIDPCISCIRA